MAGTTDAAILGVAAASAGVCTRAELRAAGLPDSTITARVQAGWLASVGPGVYEIAALATPDTVHYRAARAYPLGAISHASAARLWGFPVGRAEPGEPVEVSVPRPLDAGPKLAGVEVHRPRRWSIDHVREARPRLPATSPARTLVDLAGTEIGDRRLRYVLQAAVVARAVSLAEVSSCLAVVGGRGVAGSGRLRRLVEQLDDGQPVPESELERRLAELLDDRFRRQHRPPWYDGLRGVVDFAEPVSRTIVEADGRRWHAIEQAMVEDRRRDRRAACRGWVVLRVTWADVVDRPEATAAEIAAVVARRSRLR